MPKIKALRNLPGRMVGRLVRIECGTVIDVPEEAADQLILIDYAEAVEAPAVQEPSEAPSPANPAPSTADTADAPAPTSGDEAPPSDESRS